MWRSKSFLFLRCLIAAAITHPVFSQPCDPANILKPEVLVVSSETAKPTLTTTANQYRHNQFHKFLKWLSVILAISITVPF
jgi:hypothetical protein